MKIVTRAQFRPSLTGVIPTLGPGHDAESTLLSLIRAGASVFRINLSHFDRSPAQKSLWRGIVQTLWRAGRRAKTEVALMLDTRGPEFRTRMAGGAIDVLAGMKVAIVTESEGVVSAVDGGRATVVVAPPPGFTRFRRGDGTAKLDDGACVLDIVRHGPDRLHAVARRAWTIRHNKGVNFPGMPVSAPVFSARDRDDLAFFLTIPVEGRGGPYVPVDFVAQSFVTRAEDIAELRHFLEATAPKTGHSAPAIMAKFETVEATRADGDYAGARAIIEASDAIMIARGDLATDVERHRVPQIQRDLARLAREACVPVILATGVYGGVALESGEPTRAEAENVRSALEQAVDGFMLSNETALADSPHETVAKLYEQIAFDERQMARSGGFAARRAELTRDGAGVADALRRGDTEALTRDLAVAAVYNAVRRDAEAIFVQTMTGRTAREVSRCLPWPPVIAVTTCDATARRLLIHRGVRPVLFTTTAKEGARFGLRHGRALIKRILDETDFCPSGSGQIVATFGWPVMRGGATDTLVATTRERLTGRA
jgi:pyruvate kinase